MTLTGTHDDMDSNFTQNPTYLDAYQKKTGTEIESISPLSYKWQIMEQEHMSYSQQMVDTVEQHIYVVFREKMRITCKRQIREWL